MKVPKMFILLQATLGAPTVLAFGAAERAVLTEEEIKRQHFTPNYVRIHPLQSDADRAATPSWLGSICSGHSCLRQLDE